MPLVKCQLRDTNKNFMQTYFRKHNSKQNEIMINANMSAEKKNPRVSKYEKDIKLWDLQIFEKLNLNEKSYQQFLIQLLCVTVYVN